MNQSSNQINYTPTPPVAPSQQSQPAPVAPAEKPKSNKTLIIILILVIGLPILAVIGIITAMVLTGMNSSRNTAKDAAIKSNLARIRTEAEVYNDANGTFVGFQPPATDSGSFSQYNSQLKIQGLGQSTYVIYAKLNSGKIYCMDASGASLELTQISPSETKCGN